MSEYQAGVIVDDRYRLISRIGTGGMADVYLAEDLQLNRHIALKLLHRRFAEDPGFVERFRREAQSAAGLQHPNVVSVFDRGTFDGTYYIAMEYLDGRTLKDLIKSEAPIDADRAIEITIQVLKAARFAHRHRVIHRDLKPHNIMIDSTDHVKVTDFGIARAGASDMTETGSIMGTAQYLSPEQAQGHPVSEPSDLYSVAVVLYELVTGKVPFDGESAVSIALKHVSEAPVPPSRLNPAVPQALEQVVMWALNKNAGDRPADADEFIEALKHAREIMHAPPTEQTAMMRAVVPAAMVGAGSAGLLAAPGTQLMTTTAVAPINGGGFELADTGNGNDGGSDDEDEEKHGWAKWWPWLAALLAVLLIAGGVLAYLLTRPTKVVVPYLVGEQLNVAQGKLQAEGLTWAKPVYEYNSHPKGQVIEQSIDEGVKVDAGARLTLTVSQGHGTVNVPSVAGLSRAAAIRAITQAGFKLKRVALQPSRSVSMNQAISTSPQAGAGFPGGTAVTLFVSRGWKIPNVVGEDQSDAIAEITAAGFTPDVVKQLGSGYPVGQVFNQTPVGLSFSNTGTIVTLDVAKKPPSDTTKLPSVLGFSKAQATSTLTNAGFNIISYKTRKVKLATEDGTVVKQLPGGGTTVRKGSAVTLWIGKYKPPGGNTGTSTNSTGTNTNSTSTGTTTNPKKTK
jgi:eukaryotic-like serine/threonine-protein kinase